MIIDPVKCPHIRRENQPENGTLLYVTLTVDQVTLKYMYAPCL